MTTIATDGKILVADTQMTEGDVSQNYQGKLRKINGDLVGGAGSADNVALFFSWYENPEQKPPRLNGQFGGIVVSEDGLIYRYTSRLIPHRVDEPFYAIGSGAPIALGAMEAGANPEEAIKIACKRDIYTGRGIIIIERDDAKQRRKLQKKSGVRARGGVRKGQKRKS